MSPLALSGGPMDLREPAHDGEHLAVLDHLPEMPVTESIAPRVHREELADRLEVGTREDFRVFRDPASPFPGAPLEVHQDESVVVERVHELIAELRVPYLE